MINENKGKIQRYKAEESLSKFTKRYIPFPLYQIPLLK